MSSLRLNKGFVHQYIMYNVSAFFYNQKESVCILQKYTKLFKHR